MAAKSKGTGSPIPANRQLLSPHLFTLANYPDSVANGAEANAKWPTCCQIWGDRLPCPNPQMDDGKWVSLDDAIEWSVKRGSSESKKLSCDSKAEQEEISAYNKKMDKALRSYLIKVYNVPKGAVPHYHNPYTPSTNTIFFATSFQTKRKVMWPIFFRLSFRENMNEWESNIGNTLEIAEYPDDPALLNLKCYHTKSRSRYYGRGQKLGLFSCADKIAVLTHGDWSNRIDAGIKEAETAYAEFHAVDSPRNNMLGLNLTKTMTNRKNRNQIYIWVPDNRAKPSEQLGMVNWFAGFSRGKE